MQRSSVGSRGAVGRDRLLATARRLFTRRGASNVGINDVTAAAGVARMTLYDNFPSKDALTVAAYEGMARAALQAPSDMEASGRSDEEDILAVFDHLDGSGREADYRGRPLIHASLQAAEASDPVYAIAQSYKRVLREHVSHLLGEGRPEPRRTRRSDRPAARWRSDRGVPEGRVGPGARGEARGGDVAPRGPVTVRDQACVRELREG